MSMQCALLDVKFMMLLEELTHPKFLIIKKICGSKFPQKIMSHKTFVDAGPDFPCFLSSLPRFY